MVSSPIARIVALCACAVLAYASAAATSASQQSSPATSAASATIIKAPAKLSSKAVKNPYRLIFPVREVKARAQAVEIAPPKPAENPDIICGMKVFHTDSDTDAKIKVEPPKAGGEFSIRRLQPKVCK